MCVNFIHSIHHKFLFEHAKNIHRRRATTTLKKTFKIIQITYYAGQSHKKKDEINQSINNATSRHQCLNITYFLLLSGGKFGKFLILSHCWANLKIMGNCWLCKRQSLYHITRKLGIVVKRVHPFIQNPFGAFENWTASMFGSVVSMILGIQIIPKGSCAFFWHNCAF